MKKAFFLLGLTGSLLLCSVVGLFAQDLPTELPDLNTLTPENLFSQLVEPVYGGLVVIFGYLSYYIPGLKKLSGFYRVLAVGLVVGLGFFLFGVPFWKVTLTYLLSINLYDVFIKKLFAPKAISA